MNPSRLLQHPYCRFDRMCRLAVALLGTSIWTTDAPGFERLLYLNPGLVVDVGVGLWAWPLPMDYDGDGDFDLVVSCPDKPYNGTYFFERRRRESADPAELVLEPGVRIDRGHRNVRVSRVDADAIVTLPGKRFARFRETGFREPVSIEVAGTIHPAGRKLRARQWSFADFDGDGRRDLLVGVGDWTEYGWDDAFDETGRWTRGPLHGYVYTVRNVGTNEEPRFEQAAELRAGGERVDVFGWPSPNLADFDGDGDLDLVCGEFLDRLTYFENVGTRQQPRYSKGRFLEVDGDVLHFDLCMIVPAAVDWDLDGDVDLVVGQEDGRVSYLEHTGRTADRSPVYRSPRFFRQRASEVKFGALVTPYGFDWDGDGDDDLVCGNTAGYVAFIENLDGGDPPRWAGPRLLEAAGKPIRVQAGTNGSIQGPAEAKWGYTVLAVADWDHDGLPDIIINSIWGKIEWYRNVGTRKAPGLAPARPVEVAWPGEPPRPAWNWWKPAGRELAVQWRSSPVVVDLDGDGLNDLVALDHEGYLAFFKRRRSGGTLELSPAARIFRSQDGTVYDAGHRRAASGKSGDPLRLNNGRAGKSGRRKFTLVDWDGDGRRDLLVNSSNVHFLRNVATEAGSFLFQDMGPVHERVLGAHTTCPTVVDWNRDGTPDLVVGAEDGYLYYLENPHPRRQNRKQSPDRATGGDGARGR